MKDLITANLDIWVSAQIAKSGEGRGRGRSNKESYGVQKLRALILDLAVRGKLVPQDPKDEPASELLKRIKSEKDKLIEAGIVKRDKSSSPEISNDHSKNHVPLGWVEVIADNIFISRSGNSKLIKGKLFDSSSNDRYPGYSASGQDVWLETWEHEGVAIIISAVGARCGKAFLAEGKWSAIANTHIIFPLVEIVDKKYSMLLLNNEDFWIRSGGAQPFIKVNETLSKVIAIPPFEEQHRIVAKVDELMALCDQIEAKQTGAAEAHEHIVSTLLDALANSKDAQTFADSWQRIASHFDELFTTTESIDKLKETILQLAVMGRLVPQDPKDEPASELLKKIRKEKDKLIAEGKIKKVKPLPPITDEEKPFALPKSWVFSRLGDISTIKGGFAYQSSKFIQAGNCQVIRMGNIRPDYLRIDEKPVFIDSEYAMNTSEYAIEVDDILITMTGTKNKRDYLYSVTVDYQHLDGRCLYLNQRLCAVKSLLINNNFLNLCLKNNVLLDSVFAKSTGTANQANIGMDAIANWFIPLPPLPEQHRIVAKVDELMALCDSLKKRIIETQATQVQLADAVVERAVA